MAAPFIYAPLLRVYSLYSWCQARHWRKRQALKTEINREGLSLGKVVREGFSQE